MSCKINIKKQLSKFKSKNKIISNPNNKTKYKIVFNKSFKRKKKELVNIDYKFDLIFLEKYKPSEHKIIVGKINNIIDNIINFDISNINLKYFLKRLKHNIPIKSALKSVPDAMCLPIPIGDESKPIEIYKNYKADIKYALDILRTLIIQYRISHLYVKIIEILEKININPHNYESIKKILISKLNLNNKNLGYFHTKYLVMVSKINL